MTLSAGVLQTLTYSDHYHFPLTLQEIHHRLFFKKQASLARVKSALDQLQKDGLIEEQGGYYFLTGHASYVKARNRARISSLTQLETAKSLAQKICKVPFINAIYLTGSLAVLNSDSPSDIDFMIITKPSKLWTTRFLLTIYTSVLGLRRTPSSSDNAGKLCLNLYLTPLSYALPRSKRSLYTAYELIQAVPLFDPDNTHVDLLAANPWVQDYLPNFKLPQNPRSIPKNRNIGLLEYILYYLQYLYMHNKITREYITLQSAFFHPKVQSPKLSPN